MRKETGVPNFPKNEEEILKFWQENNIFEKLKARNRTPNNKKYFAFLDGPVTTSGPMGLHHPWARSFKDATLKYKAMKGYDAHFQNGFDSQGLPVEVKVEKELGLNSKKDIEKFGVANFTEACEKRVKEVADKQTLQSIRLGQWMDWEDSYYTKSDENMTAIWHFLKKCHEKGWIEEQYKPMMWCARCGTALSEHEMADDYKDTVCNAVFFKTPIKDTNWDMLVWTTTPWTLAANVAIAVHPELEYAVCTVKSQERKIVVGKSLTKILKGDLVKVEQVLKGSDLVGKEYEAVFPQLEVQNFVHKIVEWKEVADNEGAGDVHIAPGCGESDYNLGKELGLEIIVPVDDNGIYFPEFGFLAGKKTSEVEQLVFDKLKEGGKLYYVHEYKHRYPFCWRCKEAVIFRLVKVWFIKMDELRPTLLKAIEDVDFKPDFMRKRMVDWLTNMGDWSISRKRYYGLSLPFYKCENCGKMTVVGSLDELKELSGTPEKVDALPHLHRPYIDDIEINCPHCSTKVKRIPEVGDTWLDAGITPFSTKKYFTDKEFWKKNFPIEVVMEGREQIRLWFYSLLVMSVVLEGVAPYKKVISHPMLLDKTGAKLSKSSPNNIPLDESFEKMGADVIRYNFESNNMQSDVVFSFDVADEIKRKLLPLWNVYTFVSLYADLDKPDISIENLRKNKPKFDVTDTWLLEKTGVFVKYAEEEYDNQRFFNVTSAFEKFLDEISNWYVRVNRKRFWKSEEPEDKLAAYFTINYAIKNICAVMAPLLPFLSEYVWQNLVRELDASATESVFLTPFPTGVGANEKAPLIVQTDIVRDIITLALKLRAEKQIKIKQPLKTMFICADGDVKEALATFETIVKDELQIKNIVIEKDESKFTDEFLTVNFKAAGAVLKGEAQKLKTLLAETKDMQRLTEEYKKGKVNIGEFKALDASLFNLEKKAKQEFVIEHQNGVTVVLDITIDAWLMLEGLYRELVRAVQVQRKESGFSVEQRIDLNIQTSGESLSKVLLNFKDKICSETLATFNDKIDSNQKTLEIGDESVTISMRVK